MLTKLMIVSAYARETGVVRPVTTTLANEAMLVNTAKQ